jgi:hypothetical protein
VTDGGYELRSQGPASQGVMFGRTYTRRRRARDVRRAKERAEQQAQADQEPALAASHVVAEREGWLAD